MIIEVRYPDFVTEVSYGSCHHLACLVGFASSSMLYWMIQPGNRSDLSTAREEERYLLMNSIAPVWDMNQTWLVFGGGALLVAFPLIYGIAFSALYIPLLTFIFGLIFRA